MYIELILAGIAAITGGFINAVAGGGTLITFPVLTALGIPPVAANITNTVALCPGYLGGTYAQMSDLKGYKKKLIIYIIAGITGGLAGGFILLNTKEKIFEFLIPYLILCGSALLAIQPYVKNFLLRKIADKKENKTWIPGSAMLVIPAAVYGGYFGAGLGVILLAVLGINTNNSIIIVNALKQAISFSVNIAAALLFVFYGHIYWNFAVVMAVCSLLGGIMGGLTVKRLNPEVFRWIVVISGVIIAVIFFIK